jgi:hypothetical protein
MTVLDDLLVGEAPDASAAGARFGDGFVWFPADDDPSFDPVVDIAIGDVPRVGVEWIGAVVEQLRRQSEAAMVAVADHLDTAQPFRELGFFTAKAWMAFHLQLSGAEAYGRVQQARLRQRVGVWNHALAGGQVGVAQTRLMARIAANPRIEPDVLVSGVWNLMSDAMDISYLEFERRALVFEALADPVGAEDKAERNRQRRNAMMSQNSDGGWDLHAKLDDVGGPEFLEIFSWYVDREFHHDWQAAITEFGDGNVDATKLARTEAQRRADALLEMARAAAACPPGRNRPLPTVNFLLDPATAGAHPPRRARRPQRRDRHGTNPTTLHRISPPSRHAPRSHLHLARLRTPPQHLPRRPHHQLDRTRPHQPRQRCTTLRPPQLPQRARLHDLARRRRQLAHHRTRRHHHLLNPPGSADHVVTDVVTDDAPARR